MNQLSPSRAMHQRIQCFTLPTTHGIVRLFNLKLYSLWYYFLHPWVLEKLDILMLFGYSASLSKKMTSCIFCSFFSVKLCVFFNNSINHLHFLKTNPFWLHAYLFSQRVCTFFSLNRDFIIAKIISPLRHLIIFS